MHPISSFFHPSFFHFRAFFLCPPIVRYIPPCTASNDVILKCFKLGLTAGITAHLGEKTMWFRKKSLYSRQILYHRCDATLIAWSRVRVPTRPLASQGSPLSALCRACHVDGGKPRLESKTKQGVVVCFRRPVGHAVLQSDTIRGCMFRTSISNATRQAGTAKPKAKQAKDRHSDTHT